MIRFVRRAGTAGSLCLVAAAPLCLLSPALAAPPVTLLAQAPGNSFVVLDAPRVAEYWVSATRQAGGIVVFDGYVPDDTTRNRLSQIDGADVSWLKLESGQPANYQAALQFGLDQLGSLSEGRFSLRDNVVTLTGTAKSLPDYERLQSALQQAPAGLVLAASDIRAPFAETYNWSADKNVSGTVTLSGSVPGPKFEAQLLAASGSRAVENLNYASGEPIGFAQHALTALDLLQHVREGRAAFDGRSWLLTGSATPDERAAVQSLFEARQLAAANWSMSLAETTIAQAPSAASANAAPQQAPGPVVDTTTSEPVQAAPLEPAQEASVDPGYAFSAQRTGTGETILSGQVPADTALQEFTAITDGDTAAVSIAPGAPPSFVANAAAGLRALGELDQGQLDFAAGKWTLSGEARSAERKTAAENRVADLDRGEWRLDIAVTQPVEPAVVPPAAASPAQAQTADTSACAADVSEFSNRNPILFRSGAAIIAPELEPALDELAADLARCPDAVVHIEGHTDADGDQQLNLALSVARAEAVIAGLVARNIDPARLYAVGYGETQPIADNETAEGKRLNRRIVVTVRPEHF